jgi:hypothetical protein
MPKRKNSRNTPEKALDTLSRKRGRGRPYKVLPSVVFGRAENYRRSLGYVWHRLSGALLAATTGEEVIAAFVSHAQPYANEFVPRLAEDILATIHDPKFPKRSGPASNFLADSLAGRPNVVPRTSRDICSNERAKQRVRSPHRILRKEFYIECSCGYKGPARNDACRKCGAQIPNFPGILFGTHAL